MKKIFCYIVLLFIVINARAQQDPQFSQNMFNILSINPAAAGAEETINASVLIRQQWVGLDGAPVSNVFSLDTPFEFAGKQHGVGLTVLSDKLGMENNTTIRLSYSYRYKLALGSLNIGLNLGLQNNSLKGDWSIPNGDGFSSVESDNMLSTTVDGSKMVLDLGFGLFYQTKNMYLGASVSHLNKAKIDYGNSSESFLQRHYYLTGAYNIKLTDIIDIEPSVFIKTDAVVSQIDINTNIIYNKKLLAGVSYRPEDAIVVILGFQFKNGVRAGYSYDISISKINKPSHELLLAYRFKTKFEEKSKKYKSIRFL